MLQIRAPVRGRRPFLCSDDLRVYDGALLESWDAASTRRPHATAPCPNILRSPPAGHSAQLTKQKEINDRDSLICHVHDRSGTPGHAEAPIIYRGNGEEAR